MNERRAESIEDQVQREATQAVIDYLYRNKRDDPEFQRHIIAELLKTDGCTSAPDLCFRDCCNGHDIAYRTGMDENGNPITRSQADARFLRCMTAKAMTDRNAAGIVAPVYFACVRVFGESMWFDYIAPEPRPEPLGD